MTIKTLNVYLVKNIVDLDLLPIFIVHIKQNLDGGSLVQLQLIKINVQLGE